MLNPISLLAKLVSPIRLDLVFTAMAVGSGVMSLAGNAQGQKNADNTAIAQAESYGVKTAGIDYAADRTADLLPTRLSALLTANTAESILIDKAQAQAESDAKVNAAAAGVDGQSADAVVNDTERTQAEAQASLASKVQQESLQIQIDYTDNFVNAEIQKGNKNFKSASTGSRMFSSALSFGSGFISGGGLAKGEEKLKPTK